MSADTPFIPVKYIPSLYANSNVIVCAVLLFFCFITVALRFFTRIFIIRNVGWDDILVSLSLVSQIAWQMNVLGGTKYDRSH
jgi:hypothetical protein